MTTSAGATSMLYARSDGSALDFIAQAAPSGSGPEGVALSCAPPPAQGEVPSSKCSDH